MLREIPGPAGRLEALLEEPAERPGINRDGLVERGRGEAVRAAVVFGHPASAAGRHDAHESGVSSMGNATRSAR